MLRRLTPRPHRKIDLDACRLFVERHAGVLRALPVWTLRSVAPPHLPGIAEPLNSRNDVVTVLAVLHQRRNPKVGRARPR